MERQIIGFRLTPHHLSHPRRRRTPPRFSMGLRRTQWPAIGHTLTPKAVPEACGLLGWDWPSSGPGRWAEDEGSPRKTGLCPQTGERKRGKQASGCQPGKVGGLRFQNGGQDFFRMVESGPRREAHGREAGGPEHQAQQEHARRLEAGAGPVLETGSSHSGGQKVSVMMVAIMIFTAEGAQ